MYAAINKEGNLVYARDIKQMGGIYYCPNCKNEVLYKVSGKGNPYFSHVVACGEEIEDRVIKESKKHLKAKSLLLKAGELSGFRSYEEYSLNSNELIADVWVEDNNYSSSLEFQKSSISGVLLNSRNNTYLQAGYNVEWIFDYDIMNNKQFTSWHRRILNYSDDLGFHLKLLDLRREELVICSNLELIYPKERLNLLEYRYKLSELRDFLGNSTTNRKAKKKIMPLKYPKNKNRLKAEEGKRRQNANFIHLGNFYNMGYVLSDLPEWVVLEDYNILFIKGKSWIYFAYLWIYLKKLPEYFKLTSSDILDWLKTSIEKDYIKLTKIALVDEETAISKLAEATFTFLQKEEIIKYDKDLSMYKLVD